MFMSSFSVLMYWAILKIFPDAKPWKEHSLLTCRLT